MSILTTRNLASISAKHPWRVIGLWLILLAVAGYLIATQLGSALSNDMIISNKLESVRARKIAVDTLGLSDKITETIVIQSSRTTVDDPKFQAVVEDVFSQVMALKNNVESGSTYYQTKLPALVSPDKTMTIIPLTMTGKMAESVDNAEAVRKVLDAHHYKGYEIGLAGTGSINADTNKMAEQAFQAAETIGIPLALVIMVIVFGTVVAALIPLLVGVAAIIIALGITALVGHHADLTFYIVNMILMMGLAVGIDYALFIVSRVREERWHGRDKIEAITMAGQTAAHAVFFSGLVVLIALAGLLIVPISIFSSLAAGAIFVVAMSILAMLTLLPAVLSLMGDRLNAWKIPFVKRESLGHDPRGGLWDKLSGFVMRRAVVSVIITAGVLLALLIPAMHIKSGTAGIEAFPDTLPSVKTYRTLQKNFSTGVSNLVQVVVSGNASSDEVRNGITKLTESLAQQPKMYGMPQPYKTSDTASTGLLTFPMYLAGNTQEATQAVKALRTTTIPAAFTGVKTEVLVGGEAASNFDYFELTSHYRPIVFAFVLTLSFILLTLVFRSLVVPIKAILMNLLSVGATYGLLVLVFQDGYAGKFFHFSRVEAIDAWVPLFLFAVLFGLSMDYHVFLLSRIRERFVASGDNTESVAFGLRNTGKIITGAALIMVAVFAGFAAGKLVMFQQMGFGLGVAVLLDATIIRSILVPASMKLLGKWNWYLPKWLEWLPKIHVEG